MAVTDYDVCFMSSPTFKDISGTSTSDTLSGPKEVAELVFHLSARPIDHLPKIQFTRVGS